MYEFNKITKTSSKYYAFLSFVFGYIMNIIILFLYLFLINSNLLSNSNIGFQFIGCLILGAVASYFMNDYSGACSIFRSFIAGAAYQLGIYWFYGFIIVDLLVYNSGKTISLFIIVPLVYMTFGIAMITLFTLKTKRTNILISIVVCILVATLIQFILKMPLTYIAVSLLAELLSLPYLKNVLSTAELKMHKYLERAQKKGPAVKICGIICGLSDTEIIMPFLPFMIFKGFRKDFL